MIETTNEKGAVGSAKPGLSIFKAPQTPLAPPQEGPLTLPDLLKDVATRFADREALVLRTADEVVRWSYADVRAHSVEAARALLAGGVGKDTRVGIMMTNRPEWIAAFFGVALAGGVAVPLSTFSTQAELEYLLQASAVSTLIFERQVVKKDFAAILGQLVPELAKAQPGELRTTRFPHLRRLVVLGEAPEFRTVETWADFLASGRDISPALVEATAAGVKPADMAAIYFTSGSTSLPKGTINRHYATAIAGRRWHWLHGVRDGVRAWSPNGLFWSGTFAMQLGSTWDVGGSMVLQQTFNPEESLELLAAEKANIGYAWPHQWAAMEEASNWADVDLSSMTYVDANDPLSRHPTVRLTGWRNPLWAYGCSETFTLNTGFRQDAPDEEIAGSHGIPLPGNIFKIVDPDTGEIVPTGERGEVCLKGPTLMVNYVGMHPSDTFDDEGFYHTGDGGTLDAEGRLYWEGRLSDVIKTGGANVSPIEVTDVLVRHPGVKIGMTVGVPHKTLGELVVACVVPMDEVTLTEDDVRDFLRKELASYKVPRRVLFFQEDEIALTNNSKVKAKELRDLVAARISAEAAPAPA